MTSASTIKAIVYDVDGTMVNSEPLHVSAWDKALEQYDHKLAGLSDDFRATMAGKKPIAIATGMVEELDLSIEPEELLQTKSHLFMDLVRTDLRGMPGVVESINRFKHEGFRLGIGTSLDQGYINIVLQNLGVSSYFDVIVTGDRIANGKPHPDTYLTVARELGLAPSVCLVLEDAQSGIQSAKSAGCLCIAIENPDALKQDTSLADLTVASLDEVTSALIATLK
jgi:beta-phosphoglucomutase-like phosphatase (HAD superfamily)